VNWPPDSPAATTPGRPGTGCTWEFWLHYEECMKLLGPLAHSEEALCELLNMLLWHEFHHTDWLYGTGNDVPGGNDCDHFGLQYATALRACDRATQLAAAGSTFEAIEGACSMYRTARNSLVPPSSLAGDAAKCVDTKPVGPPDWGLPSTTVPSCLACP